MKVILSADIAGLGSKGDLVEVKDGYANNYLVPNGFAIRATKGREAELAQVRSARERKQKREVERMNDLSTAIASLDIEMEATAGPEGRLFGAVTAKDIAELLTAKLGQEIDRKKVHLEEPIKTSGFHEARIRLHPQVETIVHLKIVPKE
ncbi:MAG: 50S ribosomal protein L9 [Candidatus Geothermincolia bacterium]